MQQPIREKSNSLNTQRLHTKRMDLLDTQHQFYHNDTDSDGQLVQLHDPVHTSSSTHSLILTV